MSISLSKLFPMIADVISPAGSGYDFIMLVLSQNWRVQLTGVVSYTSADLVGDAYGYDSDEYKFAAVYFKAPDNADILPAQLLFARAVDDGPTPGWLKGTQGPTLAELQAEPAGTISIIVAGVLHTSTTITPSAAVSLSGFAATVQAALTGAGVTVAYDSLLGVYSITTTDTGSDATITAASGGIAKAMMLRSADSPVLSQGANKTALTASATAAAAANNEWVTITTLHEPDVDEAKGLAQWANERSLRYVYLPWSSDAGDLTAANPDSFGAWLETLAMDGVIPFHATNYKAVALAGAWAASLDFGRTDGRTELYMRAQSGLAADVQGDAAFDALISNGYNFVGKFGGSNPSTDITAIHPGSVPGKWLWASSMIHSIWLAGALQSAGVNFLAKTKSIPNTDAGAAQVSVVLSGVLDQFVSFGGARAGVAITDASQRQQITQAGGNPLAIEKNGFQVIVHSVTAQDKVARIRRVTVIYQDGQAIQQISTKILAVL